MEQRWFPSRWGLDDEVGALNEISASKIFEATRLVKNGKIYNLAHMLEIGIPVHWFHGPFFYSTFRRHIESVKLFGTKNNFGAMNVRIEMQDHTATHLDGINHISISDRLYNGHLAAEITGALGTSKLGMEKTPPIFTRGVLIDIPSVKGTDLLEPGYQIIDEDVKHALRHSNIEIKRGDVVLVATGWGQLWMSDNEKYSGPCPGIAMSAARLISAQGAVIVGADTYNVEAEPSENPGESGVVHQFLITKNGIRLIENMNLEALRKDQVTEFLFVCLPLRIKGGTASPVTPIAIA